MGAPTPSTKLALAVVISALLVGGLVTAVGRSSDGGARSANGATQPPATTTSSVDPTTTSTAQPDSRSGGNGGSGGSVSGRRHVRLASAGAAVSPGNGWAVVVGVTHYWGRTHPTVAGAADAQLVYETLRDAGWPADHIRLLVDGAATGSKVRAALEWLVDHSAPNTFSVFHYSGHVKQRGVGHEYLWPVDNALISNDDFGGYMRRLQGRAWIDVAGCESAGFDAGVSSPARYYSSSSQRTEKSYENPAWGYSIWAGLVFDRGIRQRQADADHDGRVSIQEAVAFAQRLAPQITRDQARGPQHPYLAGGDGTTWFLDFPKPPPPPPPSPAQGPPPSASSTPSTPPSTTPPAPDGGTDPSPDPPAGDSCSGLSLGFVRCGN